jgi:hypothetical protein
MNIPNGWTNWKFYILFTMHPSIIPVNNQLWRTFFTLFSMYLFDFSACFEQPNAHHQENQSYQYIIWYMSLCVGDCLVRRSWPAYQTVEDGQKFARNMLGWTWEINKTVTVASSWCSVLLYLQWWRMVTHKSSTISLQNTRNHSTNDTTSHLHDLNLQCLDTL